MTRPIFNSQVLFENAEGGGVERCVFERIDGNGVFVSGYTREVMIADNEFLWIGDSAMVRLSVRVRLCVRLSLSLSLSISISLSLSLCVFVCSCVRVFMCVLDITRTPRRIAAAGVVGLHERERRHGRVAAALHTRAPQLCARDWPHRKAVVHVDAGASSPRCGFCCLSFASAPSFGVARFICHRGPPA